MEEEELAPMTHSKAKIQSEVKRALMTGTPIQESGLTAAEREEAEKLLAKEKMPEFLKPETMPDYLKDLKEEDLGPVKKEVAWLDEYKRRRHNREELQRAFEDGSITPARLDEQIALFNEIKDETKSPTIAKDAAESIDILKDMKRRLQQSLEPRAGPGFTSKGEWYKKDITRVPKAQKKMDAFIPSESGVIEEEPKEELHGRARTRRKLQAKMSVYSPAFVTGEIPEDYATPEYNPEVMIGDVPSGTQSLALEMIDLDVSKEGHPFRHWVMYNIPPDVTDIKADSIQKIISEQTEKVMLKSGETISVPTVAPNDYGYTGYGPPEPPAGQKHHYKITMWALKAPITSERDIVKNAIDNASIEATYQG